MPLALHLSCDGVISMPVNPTRLWASWEQEVCLSFVYIAQSGCLPYHGRLKFMEKTQERLKYYTIQIIVFEIYKWFLKYNLKKSTHKIVIGPTIIYKSRLETSTYIYFIIRGFFLGILEFSAWGLLKMQVIFEEDNFLSDYLVVGISLTDTWNPSSMNCTWC